MKNKWAWLPDRITECGYPTIAAFADAIEWPRTRLSEMIRGTILPNGGVRNFPKNKIKTVAEALHMPVTNLLIYNNDLTDYIDFANNAIESHSEFEINDPKRMLRIAEMLNQVLAEEGLNWDWEKKYNFVMELYALGLGHDETTVANDTQQIKTSLKLARLAA